MDINDKIITIYKEEAQVDNLIPGIVQIIKKENTEEQEGFIYGYKIYDGEKWIEYYKTLENEGEEEEISYDENLSDFFSDNEDYIYFYVNRSSQNSPPINKVRKWNGDGWEDISSTRIGQILKIAADAEAIADGAIKTYSGDLTNKNVIAPNPNVGDLFIDVPNQNKLYRYNGSKWEPMDDKRLVGEGAGISFVPKDGIGASIIINQDMGLKITNNYGSYFQATADKIGFYDRDGNPKMSIGNDGNAVFSGTITAAKFVEGSELTSGTGVFEGRMYVDSQDGLLHLSNVTIDGDCTISGKMEVDLGGTVGGWVIGADFLGSGNKDNVSASFIGLSPRGSGPTFSNGGVQQYGSVFWSGGGTDPTFYVTSDGILHAKRAVITDAASISVNGDLTFTGSESASLGLIVPEGKMPGYTGGDIFQGLQFNCANYMSGFLEISGVGMFFDPNTLRIDTRAYGNSDISSLTLDSSYIFLRPNATSDNFWRITLDGSKTTHTPPTTHCPDYEGQGYSGENGGYSGSGPTTGVIGTIFISTKSSAPTGWEKAYIYYKYK